MHASLISYALKMIGLKKGMSRREGTCYHKSINRVRESVGYAKLARLNWVGAYTTCILYSVTSHDKYVKY
jgi:hypothetical protein